MALHTMGTAATTSLTACQWFPALTTTSSSAAKTLSLADAQAMDSGIFSTALVGPFLNQTAASGILLTASTHSNTTLDTFAATGGPPLAAIQVGAMVRGAGVPVDTYVVSRTPTTGTPTSVILSQAATATASGVHFVIANPQTLTAASYGFDPATGRIWLPDNRGYIQLNPGDYIAVDNDGAVIVVPFNSVNVTGSLWVFT
jgi:hypothetical protein